MNNLETILKSSKNSLENNKILPIDFKHRLYAGLEFKNRVIIGPRGTGKSTYLAYVANKYNKDEIIFLDTDSTLLATFDFRNNNQSLVKFKSAMNDILISKKIKVLLIDEIQNIFEWSKYLKQLADTYPNILFLATGSDARALTNSSELGTRRYELFFSGFYTYKEFNRRFPEKSLNEYIQNWSLAGQEKISKTESFQAIYEKQLAITRLKNFTIKNYLKLISFNPGSNFNTNNIVNKILEDSKVKPDSSQINEVIRFLEESGLIYQLEDHHSSSRVSKKLITKKYPADWNLFTYFSLQTYQDLNNESLPRKGFVFENMVISNVFATRNTLLSREGIKTLTKEPDVDLILDNVNYELKSFDILSLDTSDPKFKALTSKAIETNSIIIHTGVSKIFKINDYQNIKLWNVEEFLLNL